MNGVAYVASDERVWALEALTGAQKWVAFVANTDVLAGLTVSGSTVYTAPTGGPLDALDAATGALEWSAGVGGTVVSTPTAVGGVVYLATTTQVSAFDAATGDVRWQQPAPSYGGGFGTLAVVDGSVLCSCDGVVTDYRAGSGATRWTDDLHSSIYGAGAVADGLYVVADVSGDVVAIRYTTGAVVWTTRATPLSTGFEGSVVIANGVVYASGRNTTAVLDLTTGALLGDLGVGVRYGGAVVVDGAVYVRDTTDIGLHRFDLPSSP